MSATRLSPLRGRALTAALLACWLAGCQSNRVLPEGVSFVGPIRPAPNVQFLRDSTWVNGSGERYVDQQVFDAMFATIAEARRLIVVDMFLYNDFQGPVPEDTRDLAAELTDALLAARARHPDMPVVVITDPVNEMYGGLRSPYFERLEAAGIVVVRTDLTALPDSNPLWSGLWRTVLQFFGNSPGGLLPNPIGPGKVSLRSYFALFNFKANHRKTLIADRGDGYVAMVSSANPHDGSSAHRNAAVLFDGPAATDLLRTENAVLAFSGASTVEYRSVADVPAAATTVQIVTERQIERAVLAELDASGPGDEVRLMMFYLSDRHVIDALRRAHERGAQVRLLLDPNKDAFGRKKGGIPNRPVAWELTRAGVPLRWCDTHGEQCHAKMLLVERADGRAALISGSANLTRRNLDDYNLETDVVVRGPADRGALADARRFFDSAWRNPAGKQFSVGYEQYAGGESWWRRARYRFMETTGLSSF